MPAKKKEKNIEPVGMGRDINSKPRRYIGIHYVLKP